MASPADIIVHGRCACGRKYRIRNAAAGVIVTCPACRRTIEVTDADLRIAAGEEQLVPLQPEQSELVEAIPLDDVELRPAAAGSRPGLTGMVVHMHDESLLAGALQPGWNLRAQASTPALPRAPGAPRGFEPVRAADFVIDLLRSFYLAGRPRNLLQLALMAVVCVVPFTVMGLLPNTRGMLLFGLLLVVLELVMLLYILKFYWRTLTLTAADEDEIPTVEFDVNWGDDVIKPTLWLLIVTLACLAPATIFDAFAPPFAGRRAVVIALLVLGGLVWPMGVVSAGLGNPLAFLRPDLLIGSIFRVGPVYLLAWLAVLLVGAGFAGLPLLWRQFIFKPSVLQHLAWPVTMLAALYLGYILFRTLGLLYRHYRGRLPGGL